MSNGVYRTIGSLWRYFVKCVNGYAVFYGGARKKKYRFFYSVRTVVNFAIILLFSFCVALATVKGLYDGCNSGWRLLWHLTVIAGGPAAILAWYVDGRRKWSRYAPNPKSPIQKPAAGRKANSVGVIIGIAVGTVAYIAIVWAVIATPGLMRARMAEALTVLKSFESAHSAALAERGGLDFTESDMRFTLPNSKLFTCTIVKDPQGRPSACRAKPKAPIGKFSGTLVTEFVGEYNRMYRHGVEPADMRGIALKLVPEFFQSGEHGGQDAIKFSFTDSRDGKKYSTVKINGRTWMAENLNYKTSGSTYSYEALGRLYKWTEAIKACPAGWHLPSDEEWDGLMVAVDGVQGKDHHWETAGKKLKSKTGWDDWEYGEDGGNGTDEYGFSALPGGIGLSVEHIEHVGLNGDWWSATEKDVSSAWSRSMRYFHDGVYRYDIDKPYLLSVRCVWDFFVDSESNSTESAQTEKPAVKTVADKRDGKKYRAVKIGRQTWMAENLNYKTGDSKCYDNSKDGCAGYGRLYNWNDAKNACPAGWHLPTSAEWDKLMVAVGGVQDGRSWENAGKKLKSKAGWIENGNGTDEYGFSALPGGFGDPDGYFDYADFYGYWWSATENGASNALYWAMYYHSEYVSRGNDNKTYLVSVRCVRD